jgi:hypothetical protein
MFPQHLKVLIRKHTEQPEKRKPTTLLQFQKVKLKKKKESKCKILKDKKKKKTLWSRVIIHTETTYGNFLRRIKGFFF